MSSVFTKQQIEAIDERIKSYFEKFKDEFKGSSQFVKAVNPIELQLKRCELYKLILDGNEADDFGVTPEDKLEKMCATVVENKLIQNVLDCFDFEAASNIARKCGFTYGIDGAAITAAITKERLIKDALDAFEILESGYKSEPSATQQIGRLLAIKTTTGGKQKYTLVFLVESWDTSEDEYDDK